mmetsp:Transcript_1957/g.2421  ORF Transcript_1957/g.2421 Transcript_1957/m.2421 type:complete len:88 (+) Transcript_1957:28-291(+)
MSATPSALSLYRQMLRCSQHFKDFNIRMYALRSVKTRFRENQAVHDEQLKERLLEDAVSQLEVIKRQTAISQLYGFSSKNLVVENYK